MCKLYLSTLALIRGMRRVGMVASLPAAGLGLCESSCWARSFLRWESERRQGKATFNTIMEHCLGSSKTPSLPFPDLSHLARAMMGVPTAHKIPEAVEYPGNLCGSDCAGPRGHRGHAAGSRRQHCPRRCPRCQALSPEPLCPHSSMLTSCTR